MAAAIPKSILPVARTRTTCTAGVPIFLNYYSTEPRIIKDPTTASLKRGTGGRSSFNGIVCTIFGASSFVGRYLCNAFGKIGTQIIIPYRREFDQMKHLKLCGDLGQILFHEFDIRDKESIRRSVQYSNVVVNLIGTLRETSNFTFEDVNVKAARCIAKIAKECNVERLIHVSCLNADAKPEPRFLENGSQFLRTKWEGESSVKQEFPDATIIRASDIYGVGDSFVRLYTSNYRFFENMIPVWKNGENVKQPISVHDVATGIVAIAQDYRTAGKTYQFVGPKRYRLADLIDWIRNHTTVENESLERLNMDERSVTQYIYKLRLDLNKSWKLYPFLGPMDSEFFEKESANDVVLSNFPTLEDLGISPIEMETQIPVELRALTRRSSFLSQKALFEPPPTPQPVP